LDEEPNPNTFFFSILQAISKHNAKSNPVKTKLDDPTKETPETPKNATTSKSRRPNSRNADSSEESIEDEPEDKTTQNDDEDSSDEDDDDDDDIEDITPPTTKKQKKAPASQSKTPSKNTGDQQKEAEKSKQTTKTQPKTLQDCLPLLRFAWTILFQSKTNQPINDWQIKPIHMSLSLSKNIQLWSEQKHALAKIGIRAPHPIGQTSPTDYVRFQNSTNDQQEEISKNILTIKEHVSNFADKDETDPSRTKDPMKKIENCLDGAIITMFQHAGSSDAETPGELTAFTKKFLACKTPTEAASLFNLEILKQHKNIRLPLGCITAWWRGDLLWQSPAHPENLSFFHYPPFDANAINRTYGTDAQNIHLRMMEGKGLPEANLAKLTKQTTSIPSTIHGLAQQYKNLVWLHELLFGAEAILTRALAQNLEKHELLFGAEAILTRALAQNLEKLERNEQSYGLALAADPVFNHKFMFFVDNCRNRFLLECLTEPTLAQISWNFVNLTTAHKQILQGNFYQRLPLAFQIPTATAAGGGQRRRHDNNDDKDTLINNLKQKLKNQRTEKGEFTPNSNQHSSLKLEPGENFIDLIAKRSNQLKQSPNWSQHKSTICCNYHIQGHCHADCPRKKTHCQLPDKILNEAEEFLKGCRKNLKKKSKKVRKDKTHT
jgi:hypothetical protein